MRVFHIGRRTFQAIQDSRRRPRMFSPIAALSLLGVILLPDVAARRDRRSPVAGQPRVIDAGVGIYSQALCFQRLGRAIASRA